MTEFAKRLEKKRREEGRAKFAGYVQSIAFNMTLSRNMVDMLWAIRDFGGATKATRDEYGRLRFSDYHTALSKTAVSFSVSLMQSLERRGLVFHNPWPSGKWEDSPSGWRWHELTRAGEIMCELLVGAGLIESVRPEQVKKRRRAS